MAIGLEQVPLRLIDRPQLHSGVDVPWLKWQARMPMRNLEWAYERPRAVPIDSLIDGPRIFKRDELETSHAMGSFRQKSTRRPASMSAWRPCVKLAMDGCVESDA